MIPPAAAPWVCLDGRFLPEPEAVVPITDRCFLYGDGVFETLRAYRGQLFSWEEHWQRLDSTASLLQLPLPWTSPQVHELAAELLRRNGLAEAVVRLQCSRGSGPRGYSPKNAGPARLVLTTHPAPDVSPDRPAHVRLHTVPWPAVGLDRRSACKSPSRLLTVLARAEAEAAGADAALLLNTRGEVTEADSANVFWIEGPELVTPPLECGALDGVTRRHVLRLCQTLQFPVAERPLPAQHLPALRTLCLTSSVREILRVSALDGRPLDPDPRIDALHRAYRQRVEAAVAAA